jgi:RNA polymerase sigma factor (sigma-70 family)
MTNEELALKIQAGQSDLILELWNNVKKLINVIACKYLPSDFRTNCFEIDDLIQAGYIGMINAIKDYDPSKEFKFTTYLKYHVKNEIRSELGIKTTKRDALFYASSMDLPLRVNDDGSELTLADLIPAEDKYEELCEQISTDQLVSIVLPELEKLNEFYQNILIKRYIENMSLSDIAKELNCSRQNVHLHEKMALKKLRDFKTIKEIMAEKSN